MLSISGILFLAAYYFMVSWKLREYTPEKRTVRLTKSLSRIIHLSPLIGVVVFAILLIFLLKGRFAERATHAFLVFAIWMYATRFYQYILSFYKNKWMVSCSFIGMALSVMLAVILTPLDRYVSLVYSRMNRGSIFLGGGLYLVFYTVAFAFSKKVKKDTVA